MNTRPAIVAACLCFSVACGPSTRRLATIPSPPSAEVRDFDDDPDGAAEYYLLKRLPPGATSLPVERYLTARDRLRRMRVYSSTRRAIVNRLREVDAPTLTGGGTWEELGPGNIGGRTRTLLIHPQDPNIMYAAGVAGGVWKSIDAGTSWKQLNDFLPNISISTMVFDPKNPETLYAGTGESFAGDGIRGLGIFKTTDAGQTFAPLSATLNSNFYGVNKLVISPNNSQVIYAATQTGLWRSLDAGESFQQVLNPAAGFICTDLAIRTDVASDYLFAACRVTATPQSGSIYRNQDAAGSGQWIEVLRDAAMRRTTLAIAPSNQGIIYAMAATGEIGDLAGGLLAVYASPASGDLGSWEVRASNKDSNRLNVSLLTNPAGYFADVCSNGARSFSNQGGYDNVIAVDPLNPDIVWAGGIDLFRSDDGGRNWGIAAYWNAATSFRTYVHADAHVLLFHPGYDGHENQQLFAATDGGIFRTDNALAAVATGDRAACSTANSSVNWNTLNHNYATAQFYHGSVYPGGHFYFGGLQDNGTARGGDSPGVQNWTSILGGDGAYTAIDPTNVNRFFVETQRASTLTWLRRSLDGGKTFTVAMTGIDEPADATHFLFATPYAMDPKEPNRLYFAGQTLWRSDDGASHWAAASAPMPTGIISAIAVSPSDSNTVLAGTTAGYIHRSQSALSAGSSTAWDRVLPRAGNVSSIAFDPANPGTAYATYSAFNGTGVNVGHVFMTQDFGANWTRIDGTADSAIPDIPAHSIVVNPISPTNLYVGTDLGVFVSLDSGATWAREDTQFPTTEVAWLAVDSGSGAPVLYAFTHGRGAWRARLSNTPACAYKLTADRAAIAFGETYPVHVDTGDACVWSAITSTFANLESPGRGAGSGDAMLTFPLNTGTVTRTATIQVADQTATITQDRPIFPAGNDETSRPFPIQQLPFASVQDTRTTTVNASDPAHSCAASSADAKTVWLSYTATFTGTLRLSASGTRYDNLQNYGIILSAYDQTGTPPVPGPELACAAGPATGTTTAFANVDLAVTEGAVYLIELSGAGDNNVGGYTVFTASRKD